jgi:hypothetical protein
MKHQQAEPIKQWLEDTDQQLWVWLTDSKTWSSSYIEEVLSCPNLSYAIGKKPTAPPTKMCELAGVKFPAPVSDANLMEKGQKYWIASAHFVDSLLWRNDAYDCRVCDFGLTHLTKESAEQHSKALMAANLQAITCR